jgi:hypothetical protein
MTKCTGLVAAHRELLVVEHSFAKKLYLLNLIVRRCAKPIDCLGFDAVDLGFDQRDLLECLRRKDCTGRLRLERIGIACDDHKQKQCTAQQLVGCA